MIYVDAHVHVHPCYRLEQVLDSTVKNFTNEQKKNTPDVADIFVLMLAEMEGSNFFSQLYNEQHKTTGLLPPGWEIVGTQELDSCILRNRKLPDMMLVVIAGRQIVSEEKIEVLALGTIATFAARMPVGRAVVTIKNHDALPVLPWGVGKWLGARGKIITELLGRVSSQDLFIGDNGGRPVFWPAPLQFKLATKRRITMLPGSDPLGFSGDEKRIGSFGGTIAGEISLTTPCEDLKKLLLSGNYQVTPYGRRQGVITFWKNQMAVRR